MKLLQHKYKEFLFSDFMGKIIAILLACFLWYYVNIISIEKVYISLPVSAINQPEDKIVDVPDDLAIRVEISTHEDVSRRIENLTAVIDLSNYTVGSEVYPITLLNLPKDIKASITPDYQRIDIYNIISKTVPINLVINTNKLLTNISYSPKQISISGSSFLINNIKALNTFRLTYNTPITGTLSTNIKISYPSEITVLDYNSVDVVLQFDQTTYTNEVLLPIKYIENNSNLQVLPISSFPLQLVTPTSNIEPLLLDSEIEIDLSAISNAGVYDIPINIIIPSNTYLVDPPATTLVELIPIENSDELETFFDESILDPPSEDISSNGLNILTNAPSDTLPNNEEIINKE